MRFAIHAVVENDGKWHVNVEVPNGATVYQKEVVRLLALCLGWATEAPDARVPTVAEVAAAAAACALPDGWQVTLDAVNIEVNATTSGRAFSRTYRYGSEEDGEPVVAAPCAEDGSSIPATREALLAVEQGREPGEIVEGVVNPSATA